MLELTIVCIVAFIIGALAGKLLAIRGITADNALDNHQKPLLGIVISLGLILAMLIVLDKFNLASLLPLIFPPLILVYFAGYLTHFIVGFGFFTLGFLLLLELSGKHSRQRMFQLLFAIGAIVCALSILFVFLRPVDRLLRPAKIIDEVVWQTTPFTCAPASIATLGRYSKIRPNLTEKETVKLAKTNRFGTTTLAEIRAMRRLELQPKYQHNLSIEDLIEFNKLALLHVKEINPKTGYKFSHAVALLSIDTAKKIVIIGNPLYGIQIKNFSAMEDYWLGEAILVNLSSG